MGAFGIHRVFVDANVWYSRTLRDWVGMLYLEGEWSPYIVFWSEDVLTETLYHLRKDHPEWSGTQISSIRARIASTFEIGRVDDFEVDEDFPGNDPHDAHVHAAAVSCEADILLTCDVSDFAPNLEAAAVLPYELYTPDEFLVLMDNSAPDLVRAVAFKQVDYQVSRGREADLPLGLKRAGAPEFAERVRHHLQHYGRS